MTNLYKLKSIYKWLLRLSILGILLFALTMIGISLFVFSTPTDKSNYNSSSSFWVMVIGSALFGFSYIMIAILGIIGILFASKVDPEQKRSYIAMAIAAITFMPLFGTMTMLSMIKRDIGIYSYEVPHTVRNNAPTIAAAATMFDTIIAKDTPN